MANEVEIRITADDMTGPAFRSVMGRLAELKAAADAAAKDRQLEFSIGDALAKVEALQTAMKGLKVGGIDMSELDTSLMALRSKMQSLGIADIADVDVQPGRLMTQLQMIKRLIQQAGISDVLDFNLKPADLTAQLEKLQGMAFNIPVKFDMSKMPALGSVGVEHVPIMFDISKVPIHGPTMPLFHVPADIDVKNITQAGEKMPVLQVPANIEIKNFAPAVGAFQALGSGLTEADKAISPLILKMHNLGIETLGSSKYMSMLGMSFSEMIPLLGAFGSIISSASIPAVRELGSYIGTNLVDAFNKASFGIKYWSTIAALGASDALKRITISAVNASAGVTRFNSAIDSGLPLWQASGALWGGLAGRLQLFGGWLTKLGAPAWLGTVSGLHMLVEGILEVSAVVIPATIALAAFAAAAVPTVQAMFQAESNMWQVSKALGLTMPGLSGGFSKMAAAVQPNVYILAGEALNTINQKTGIFQTLAQGAGQVMDQLGARVEMALGGNGLNGFISHGVDDLRLLGNVFGNIFGIIGNILKTVPGYAELLFKALGDVTGALENITSSGAVQGLIALALGFHGAIFYAGLLATGLYALKGPLTAIVTWALDGIATLSAMSAMFLEAAATEGIFAATTDMLSLANPWMLAAVGVGLLVAGLITLSVVMSGQVNQQRAYLNVVESTISAQTTFAGQLNVTKNALQTTNSELAKTPQYVQQTVVGMHDFSTAGQAVNTTYTNLANNSQVLTAQLAMEHARQAQLVQIFGSVAAAQTAMAQAGIPLSAIADANRRAWQQDVVQLQALNSATVQLAGFQNGQAAAAQNALNFMSGQISDIQKLTQAQDGLMNAVTGSETAFQSFALGQITLAGNFGLNAKQANTLSHSLGDIKLSTTSAGASMGGLNQASLTLGQSFYSQVSNAQKLIDALEQGQTPAKNMAAAVGAMAAQLVPFAQNDAAARATLIAMINDALGPATVNSKNLDTWIKNNATSMGGLNSIVEQATIKMGQLANVLQNSLTAQFQAALLQTSGTTQAIKNYAQAITDAGGSTTNTKSARDTLIADLEKTGMSAQDATTYVDNLQHSVDAMHGKTVKADVGDSASVAKTYVDDLRGSIAKMVGKGVIVSVSTGTAQSNVVNLQAMINSLHGKTVTIGVQTVGTSQLPSGFLNGIFASGGIVGGIPRAASGGHRSGLTLVGELGPELVRLPHGSQVYPSNVTPGYASQGAMGGGGPNIVQFCIESSGSQGFDAFMLEWIREHSRIKGGGNVQKAFGRS